MEWISVEDRLPERSNINFSFLSKYVFAYGNGHYYSEALYNHFLKCWHNKNLHNDIEVTHWAHREPPKED